METGGFRYLRPVLWRQGGQTPEENRYHTLDEREVASSLQDWLKERHSLPEETASRWTRRGGGAGETSPALSGDGEALVIGSSYSSWDLPIEQKGSQDIEGDE